MSPAIIEKAGKAVKSATRENLRLERVAVVCFQ